MIIKEELYFELPRLSKTLQMQSSDGDLVKNYSEKFCITLKITPAMEYYFK